MSRRLIAQLSSESGNGESAHDPLNSARADAPPSEPGTERPAVAFGPGGDGRNGPRPIGPTPGEETRYPFRPPGHLDSRP